MNLKLTKNTAELLIIICLVGMIPASFFMPQIPSILMFLYGSNAALLIYVLYHLKSGDKTDTVKSLTATSDSGRDIGGNEYWVINKDHPHADKIRELLKRDGQQEPESNDAEVSVQEMKDQVNEYLTFNGIGIANDQYDNLIAYLTNFRSDKAQFEDELVCEIRTINGD